MAEAEGHLARADELFAETSTFLPFPFDACRALVRIAAGDPRGCLEAALVGASGPGVPPTQCERLMPLAARALADLAEAVRDAGGSVDPVLSEVDELERRFPTVIHDNAFDVSYEAVITAMDHLYRAELGRARGDPACVRSWVAAAATLHELPWDECYAQWRLAEALLHESGSRRDDAVAALRRAHELARRLEAVPLATRVAALARTARVPLAEPEAPGAVDTKGPTSGPSLTRREQEVLVHIVAGRTYGEIARALVLSEKTVSSHVSHLLAKTGTANRVDLAQWAARRETARP